MRAYRSPREPCVAHQFVSFPDHVPQLRLVEYLRTMADYVQSFQNDDNFFIAAGIYFLIMLGILYESLWDNLWLWPSHAQDF